MSEKITTAKLREMKQQGEKICSLTCYDAGFARILDDAGVEVVLVGDSLGMVLHGSKDTLGVSLDDMVYHTRIVSPPCRRALVVADMPGGSYDNDRQALASGRRLVDEGAAEVVKLEGGEEIVSRVETLVKNGIAVCGHVGLQPQSVQEYGGYKVQGRDRHSAKRIEDGALALQEAGAAMVVLECIPAGLAAGISSALSIPTIGIGAGVDCDGQVLVLYDLLGISQRSPRMAKNFLAESGNIRDAVGAYISAVKAGSFPAAENSFE